MTERYADPYRSVVDHDREEARSAARHAPESDPVSPWSGETVPTRAEAEEMER